MAEAAEEGRWKQWSRWWSTWTTWGSLGEEVAAAGELWEAAAVKGRAAARGGCSPRGGGFQRWRIEGERSRLF